MSKNLMPEVAKLLGVEFGERFKINGLTNPVFIKQDGLYSGDYIKRLDVELTLLLCGKYKIIKQPKLSQTERVILENLPKEYEWITRDCDGDVCIYEDRPEKQIDYGELDWSGMYGTVSTLHPFNHLFQFIKFEDSEPYSIKELLEEKQ